MRSLLNPIPQDTPFVEEVSGHVTITDPTHPLYGQTLPLLTVRVNRSKTHVTVLLPTGRRRSVPKASTDLERPAEEASSVSSLPVISVRTMLPLARCGQKRKQAKEERDAFPSESNAHSTDHCLTSACDALVSAPSQQPAATRAPGRRVAPARPAGDERQGEEP